MLAQYFPFPFDTVIEARARAVQYTYDGEAGSIPLRDEGLIFVMRSRFDAFILEHARAEIQPAKICHPEAF